MPSLGADIITKAESFPGIKAGIARLEDILKAPSYQVVPDAEWPADLPREGEMTTWPPEAKSVLVLGLHHPEDNLPLDWWDGDNTMGNRQLMEISDALRQWVKEEHGLDALPLPYHVESGGVFLKDAAVMAGLGIVGRSNLLINSEWGPRIRFRSILIEGELELTRPLVGFSPCESCGEACYAACPQNAFSTGAYHRPKCIAQMNADMANRIPGEEIDENGSPGSIVKYCRACEFACPVGR